MVVVTNLSIKKRLLKIILLIILLLVVLPGISLAAYSGLNFYQAKNLVAEADSLVKVEKYDQAIEKYALSEAKWSPQSFKSYINNNLQQAQKLKEEKELYERGVKYFDEEKWESAKEGFEKITDSSKYYEDSRNKLEIINEKIESLAKAEKAKSSSKSTSTKTQTAPTTSITTPIPQVTSNPNKDSLCRNEAELYKIKLMDEIWAGLKSKRPEIFYSSDELLAHGWPQGELSDMRQWQQNTLNAMKIEVEKAGQTEYLKKYNECLNK